jgi:NADPH:quinone reductase-like Zn-dependent oxidoreductase
VRAVVTSHGGYNAVQAKEWPDPPAPRAEEIRISVRAAGTGFFDLLARTGFYPDAPKLPAVLGYEVAGLVESLGPGVDGFVVGDRVMAATHFGGQAELAVAQARDCTPLEAQIPFEVGAAVPLNYATAWAAAMVMGGLRAGDTLLVHSAAGGMGTTATQIGRNAGARVIGIASATKHNAVLANGADEVIDYRAADVVSEVMRLTGDKGVDVILDPLGPTSFRRSYRMLRPGGRLIVYGLSEIQTGEHRSLPRALSALARLPFSTTPWWKSAGVLNENKGVFGLNLYHWWKAEKDMSRLLQPIAERLAQGSIRPVVSSRFPFSRAAEARRYLQERRNVGKVVLTPD